MQVLTPFMIGLYNFGVSKLLYEKINAVVNDGEPDDLDMLKKYRY